MSRQKGGGSGFGFSRQGRGFTLVELLAVLALIALMVTLTVAALSGLGRATALTTAGAKVAGAISLARQNAMGRNVLTALIIPTDTSREDCYRAYTIYELPAREDGSLAGSADWRQLTKWETLPKGVIISPHAGTQLTSSSDPALPAFPAIQRQNQTLHEYKYVLFSPTGSVTKPSFPQAPKVRLAEGFWEKNSASPTYTRPGEHGEPANYFDIAVVSATGAIKIDRAQ